ncbi:hypothetical protein L810_7028 [Burkholderia sp. AU4i]|nr:hypothetical protein L810_7028 [Burkholderia sp. AU4i]
MPWKKGAPDEAGARRCWRHAGRAAGRAIGIARLPSPP